MCLKSKARNNNADNIRGQTNYVNLNGNRLNDIFEENSLIDTEYAQHR